MLRVAGKSVPKREEENAVRRKSLPKAGDSEREQAVVELYAFCGRRASLSSRTGVWLAV